MASSLTPYTSVPITLSLDTNRCAWTGVDIWSSLVVPPSPSHNSTRSQTFHIGGSRGEAPKHGLVLPYGRQQFGRTATKERQEHCRRALLLCSIFDHLPITPKVFDETFGFA